jgi:hypothetical protein
MGETTIQRVEVQAGDLIVLTLSTLVPSEYDYELARALLDITEASTVVMLAQGSHLIALSDEELAGAGLMRIPEDGHGC